MKLRRVDVERDSFCGVEAEVKKVASLLEERGWMLSTAESCTGGMVAALCTAMSGSSAWFEGGVVTYANSAKIRLLNVTAGLIDEHGAVSQLVAERMALGALEVLGSDISIAITGIAGPTGGTEEKPVGTVWLAVGTRHPQPTVMSRCFRFKGSRCQVRLSATQTALYLLLEVLQKAKE